MPLQAHEHIYMYIRTPARCIFAMKVNVCQHRRKLPKETVIFLSQSFVITSSEALSSGAMVTMLVEIRSP